MCSQDALWPTVYRGAREMGGWVVVVVKGVVEEGEAGGEGEEGAETVECSERTE